MVSGLNDFRSDLVEDHLVEKTSDVALEFVKIDGTIREARQNRKKVESVLSGRSSPDPRVSHRVAASAKAAATQSQ